MRWSRGSLCLAWLVFACTSTTTGVQVDDEGGADARDTPTGGGGTGTGGRGTGGRGTADSGAGAGGTTDGAAGMSSDAAGTGGASATGGAPGLDASVGGSSGAGGAEIDADVSDDVPIQHIQDGTFPLGSEVTVQGVFVTAARQQTSGGYNFVLQEPEGQTTDGHVYPAYAGLSAFVSPALAASLWLPAPGDCADVSGTVAEFQRMTQITVSSTLRASDCGQFPVPLTVPSSALLFAQIASDTDPDLTGNQPGEHAERLEGVLLRVLDLQAVSSAATATFPVVRQADPTGATLLVSNFYYAVSATEGDDYSSLTGVFNQFNDYVLQPRSSADVLR